MNKHIVKPGRLIQVTQGAYSSYTTVGWFVCVQEYCPEDEVSEYMATVVEKDGRRRFSNDAFMAALLKKGFLAEVAPFFDEWHLADYGDVDDVYFAPSTTGNSTELRT